MGRGIWRGGVGREARYLFRYIPFDKIWFRNLGSHYRLRIAHTVRMFHPYLPSKLSQVSCLACPTPSPTPAAAILDNNRNPPCTNTLHVHRRRVLAELLTS